MGNLYRWVETFPKARFYRVNIIDNVGLEIEFRIRSLPTILISVEEEAGQQPALYYPRSIRRIGSSIEPSASPSNTCLSDSQLNQTDPLDIMLLPRLASPTPTPPHYPHPAVSHYHLSYINGTGENGQRLLDVTELRHSPGCIHPRHRGRRDPTGQEAEEKNKTRTNQLDSADALGTRKIKEQSLIIIIKACVYLYTKRSKQALPIHCLLERIKPEEEKKTEFGEKWYLKFSCRDRVKQVEFDKGEYAVLFGGLAVRVSTQFCVLWRRSCLGACRQRCGLVCI